MSTVLREEITAMHLCGRCGHFKGREAMTNAEITTGVFECSNCHVSSRLNIVVTSKAEIYTQPRST